jgi:hypothetical protein
MFDLHLPPRAVLTMLCALTAAFFWSSDVLFYIFCSMAALTCISDGGI